MPTLTSMTGLLNIQNSSISDTNSPKINTNILFKTTDPGSVPITCGAIVDAAKRDGSINTFLEKYNLASLTANIQGFRDGLLGNGVDQLQLTSNSPQKATINSYMNTVQTTQLPVLRLVDTCLFEASTPDFKKLEKTQDKVDVSKTRLDAIRDSDTKVSYYEGWFPLFRPMSEVSLFSLFTVSVFALLFSIAVFLRMNGIELELIIPGGSEFSKESFVPYLKIGSILAAVISLFVIFYKK
jgi:hypothetical protein